MSRRSHIEAFARALHPNVALTMCSRMVRRAEATLVLWHERESATCLRCRDRVPSGRRRPMTTELKQQLQDEREAQAARNAAFEASLAPLLAGVATDGKVPTATEALTAALAMLDQPEPGSPDWWRGLRTAIEGARVGMAAAVPGAIRPLKDAPRDGRPFVALVRDWYRKGERFALLQRGSADLYWEEAYFGNQTYDDEDIVGCWNLPEMPALAEREAARDPEARRGSPS